ncbi:MAG: sulfite exporter TauE/SafE family protein [Anaerolineales bacterium]|nr:sulfite exporter TauE/SafE family protein [Anaerolineales bacterium]
MDPLSWMDILLIGLAGMAGGAVNALAGGGTLITFPMLTAVGIPAVAANVTNTVALSPGYLSATFAQMKDLKGQGRRLYYLVPAGILGGLIGGVLLLNTQEKLFRELVPFLILLACGLLAVQDTVRKWLVKRTASSGRGHISEMWVAPLISLAGIYGGYFGAGLSVIILSVLGLILDESLTRLNALKQGVAFSVNMAAAVFFLFSDKVVWPAALVMAAGAILGGTLGGKLASRIKPSQLRWVVVTIGVIVAVIYFFR